MKKCNHCKEEKPNSEFGKNKNELDNLNKRCKTCCKKYSDKYGLKEKIIPEFKICSCCLIEKNKINFHKKRTSKDGLNSVCKLCRVDKTKEYNSKNREKVKESNRKWRAKNPNYSNKDYRNNRNRIDFLFRLRNNTSSLIRQSFKILNFKKSKKTMEILGCDIETFKNHIESQFLNWMSWDNMGGKNLGDFNTTWDIDHIIPLSSATTEEEIYKLNHYTNLQPLCSKTNRNIKKDDIPLICNIYFRNNK